MKRTRNRKSRDPRELFWSKVTPAPALDCWIWNGPLNTRGYGMFTLTRKGEAKRQMAHRFAYEHLVGPIPDGLVLDHFECQTHACVNPWHLDPVTHKVNSERGICGEVNRRRILSKTHCKHNHEWTPDNTQITPEGHRRCRRCAANSAANARKRKRA